MIDWDALITGGGGGIGGIILGFLGLRSKVNAIETKVCRKQDKATCTVIKEAFDHRFDTMEKLQKETRDDIKVLLGRHT